jgi:hydroxymethylpyrimidine pyrophosphatase-like HAD family hydrolase
MEKGWIALDIDGTITLDKYSVPEPVTAYLRELSREGWRIAMATGRPFRFASMALREFDFPYIFLCQNGSVAIEMPAKKILFKRYLTWDSIGSIEEAFHGMGGDFIVYMGVDRDDLCYFRPDRFTQEELPEIAAWQATQKETWKGVKAFTPELMPSFPLVKCFGLPELMEKIAKQLKSTNRFQVALMRNPFDPALAIVLITERGASKGLALQELFKRLGRGRLVIAAGDDENDLSLLQAADVKIAMSHAPDVLQEFADILAPPTSKMGIIHALKMAIGNGK